MLYLICVTNIKMKKIQAILSILLLLSGLIQPAMASNEWYTKFIITAYYSPLPNQSYYLRWNYIDEVRLNWEGIRWASWKPVYSWMIAAPKTYAFWTKIFFEWIWVWTVDDRWWAIVWSWSRGYDADRIDIWMWYWDEWLKRALTWWKREVYWRILPSDSGSDNDWIQLENFKVWPINLKTLSNSKNVWKNDMQNITQTSLVPLSLNKNSDSQTISKLQNIFEELGYASFDDKWKYTNELISTIMDFQINEWIISSDKDYWAGSYWPKTRKALYDRYLKHLESLKEIELEKQKEQKRVEVMEASAAEIISSFGMPKPNEVWSNIRNLQKTLKLLWFFNTKDTAIYWELTRLSIMEYQKSKWLIITENDDWAWLIWEKTLANIKNDLIGLIEKNPEIAKTILK